MAKDRFDIADVTATIFILLGALTTFFGIALSTVWTQISKFLETSGLLTNLINFDATITALLCIAFGILYLITGYLVLERYKEGRFIAVFFGIIFLFAFPIGTVLGLLIIYAMVISEAKNEFRNEIKI